VNELNVPGAVNISYDRIVKASTTELEDMFGVNANIILVNPSYSHEPSNILQTYGRFVLKAYQELEGRMKPRGLLIPEITAEFFDQAKKSLMDNQRNTARNISFEIDEYNSVICYFYTSTGSTTIKKPKNMPRADLSKLLIGYIN
jgi:hypothetical protein